MVGKAHKWGIFKLRGLLLHPMPLSLKMPPPMELPLYVYVRGLVSYSSTFHVFSLGEVALK
jgi:hypothetical protein